MAQKKTAVVGGGASGLIAALFASERSVVTVFEKQKKIGRKLLVTGNGRCNISNSGISAARYHGHYPDFAAEVFSRFGFDDTERFFRSIGIPFVEEGDGKLYPASLQASIVPAVFEYELKKRNVDIRVHRKIEKIVKDGDRFRLITAGMEEEVFDSVILACGSQAFPASGASRSGYELAESMGHRVYEPFPAILPINIPLKILHTLQGIKWDCCVKIISDGVCIAESCDELLFTAYGISGPAALKVSRTVNEHLLAGKSPIISIDFFPGFDGDGIDTLLDTVLADDSRKLSFALMGILKDRMPEVVLSASGIDHQRRCGSLTADERVKIASLLKDFRIAPGKPRGFDEAVVAAGGVDVREIDPATMESKIVKNLFITGELLDIDGDSGGFNLQFAWSTGAIAGRNV